MDLHWMHRPLANKFAPTEVYAALLNLGARRDGGFCPIIRALTYANDCHD